MTLFRDSLNHFWSANTSQIYRELQALEKKGFASVCLVKQTDKPDKKVFSITDSGRAELREWLEKDDIDINDNFPILMKVFFLGELDREVTVRHFQDIKWQCRNVIENVLKAGKHAAFSDKSDVNVERAKYWKMTIDFGIRYARMLNEWCDECIETLTDHTAD